MIRQHMSIPAGQGWFSLRSQIEQWLEDCAPGASLFEFHVSMSSRTVKVIVDFVNMDQVLMFKLTWGGK